MVMIQIYIACGQYDAAFDEMEYLLSLKSSYTTNDFKLRPEFEILHDHPRFKELMAKYAYSPGV